MTAAHWKPTPEEIETIVSAVRRTLSADTVQRCEITMQAGIDHAPDDTGTWLTYKARTDAAISALVAEAQRRLV